jgi:uncharacterized protein (TIGR00661 family)
MKPKSFLFIVQGEGRGHLTQAISMYNILQRNNMELCCVAVGMHHGREIPAFFQSALNVPVVKIVSPGFIKDSNQKAINWPKTIFGNLLKTRLYFRSLNIIHKLIQYHQPDVIVNFYEPLSAIYCTLFRPSAKVISIAHQFVYLHPDFNFPEGNLIKTAVLKNYTRFLAFGSDRILALSIYPLAKSKNQKLAVIPPLIRPEILEVAPERRDFILAYIVNSGYMENIIRWHNENPGHVIHCFTDSVKVKTEMKGMWKYDDTLTFHSLQDALFIKHLASCCGLVTTAGFESVCEAMFLSKPVMMIPVERHYEQFCNAVDAQKSGAGIHSTEYNISRLINYLPFYHNDHADFQTWALQTERIIMQSIRNLYPSEYPITTPTADIPIMKIV